MTQMRERVHVAPICSSVGLGQLEDILRWYVRESDSSSIETALESRSSSGSDSGIFSEAPMIPMAYSFEPSGTDSGSSSETSSDDSDLGKAAACCHASKPFFLRATTSVYLTSVYNSKGWVHVFASSISPAHNRKYCMV